MKKILMLLTCFVSLSLTAQEITSAKLESGEWQLLSQKDGVTFYVKKEACHVDPFKTDLIYAMIRIENASGSDVNASFALGLLYDTGCEGCLEGQNEAYRSVSVPAGKTVEGNCSFENNQLTYLISNPNHTDVRVFNGVKLIEFNID